MRIAWFSPARIGAPGPSDDTALLVRALAPRHAIEAIDASRAHDFVWQHARQPFDLCVFELGGTPAHDFVAAYAVHYPGVVLLRGVPRHHRALQGSRLVVVPHDPVAQAVADDYPGARVTTLTPGVDPLPDSAGRIVVALQWPPNGAALTYAISGFAARRAVIVFDGPETADWPSLDPQNWQIRGLAPICVSIDPRDERHSLRLAMRRLESDPALCEQLGAAAHAWWREHATVDLAASAFDALLEQARTLPVPPGVLRDDGTGMGREILKDCAVPWPLTPAEGSA